MRLNRVPFWLVVPFAYLAFYASIIAYLILWPVVFVYGMGLCLFVWSSWRKIGKDVLIVHSGSEESGPWMDTIGALVESRAVVLNYQERKNWRRFSLAVQLFHCFGPKPTTEFLMPRYLPAVIVLKPFRLPKLFGFGSPSKREATLERLRSAMNLVNESK